MLSLLLIRRSWVVFVYAIAISVESIIIEYLTAYSFQFSPITLSAISITSAGTMLLLAAAFIFKKKEEISILFTKSSKTLVLASLSLSLGILTWYDSINKIGASKQVLIAGPLEIVIIVILARIFLNERLNRFHVIGIIMALVGFFMAVASGASTGVAADNTDTINTISTSSLSPIISVGDIEAISSAFGFAIAVLFLSKLFLKHPSIGVAGASMFTSGSILVGFMIVGFFYSSFNIRLHSDETSSLGQPFLISSIVLFLFSLIPFIGSLSYSTGLSRIGASLTATIGSSSILITIIIQIILKELGRWANRWKASRITKTTTTSVK